MTSRFRALAHASLDFNAPLSHPRAAALVRELPLAPGRHVLDLGCGWGELLLLLVERHPGTTGTGVDTDRSSLDRGRAAAALRGIADRVDLVEADVSAFAGRGDLVLAIGSSHAWGGSREALEALRGHLEPGGALLFGDAVWDAEPPDEARALFGDLHAGDELVSLARTLGYAVLGSERSTADEWDAFESSWVAPLLASDDPGARALGRERAASYERVYRGVLGFSWLLLS